MDKLNDHCLMSIFNFSTARDLIQYERVCKRWQGVIGSMPWKRVSILSRFELRHLRLILEKYGTGNIALYIRPVEVSYDPVLESYFNLEEVFKIINEYCKKFIKLEISRFRIRDSSVFDAHRFPFLKNLKSLRMYDIQYVCVDEKSTYDLMEFWENTDCLREFKIDQNGTMTIDSTKEDLSVEPYVLLSNNFNFENLFKRCSKVKNLSLYLRPRDPMYPFDISLHHLNPISHQLISLKLYAGDHYVFLRESCKALLFHNLRTLHLINCHSFNDDSIFTFVQKCPSIEELGLLVCRNVTEIGYRRLGDLKKLTDFQFSSCGEPISSKTLEYIATRCTKLEVILLHWPNIILKSSELINIVTLLPNLKWFGFGSIEYTTKKCFQSVLALVNQRTNGKPLEIEFSGLEPEQLDNIGLKRRSFDEQTKKWLAPKPFYLLMITATVIVDNHVQNSVVYYVDN